MLKDEYGRKFKEIDGKRIYEVGRTAGGFAILSNGEVESPKVRMTLRDTSVLQCCVYAARKIKVSDTLEEIIETLEQRVKLVALVILGRVKTTDAGVNSVAAYFLKCHGEDKLS